MKVTFLAFNILATTISANMAEDFVNNLNANTSIDTVSVQHNDTRREQKRQVLRGSSKVVDINTRELKNHKRHKDNKDSDDNRPYNSHGLNYFVPSHYQKHDFGKSKNKDDYDKSKFNPGYTARPRPSDDDDWSSEDFKYNRPVRYDDDIKKEDSKYTRPPKNNYDEEKKSKDWQIKDKEPEDISYVKPDTPGEKEEYQPAHPDKEKAEEVNVKFSDETEEENGWFSTSEPTTAQPSLGPSLSPTWSPTLEPTPARKSRGSDDTATGSSDEEIAVPTLQPSSSPTLSPTMEPMVVLTGAPTFDETGEPTVITGSPTFDETGEPTHFTGSPTFDETSPKPTIPEINESSTSSTASFVTTTGWGLEDSNVTWSIGKPQRTRAPLTAEPTLKDTVSSPTLSPSISTDDPTLAPSQPHITSTDAPVNNVDTNSPTINTESPTYFPSYVPTTANITSSPTFYDNGSTTTTEATSSTFNCVADFCEQQLSDDYLMKYKLNVPDGENVYECQTCSVTISLTYDGEAWLGFAFSTDGQMVGSEAVM